MEHMKLFANQTKYMQSSKSELTGQWNIALISTFIFLQKSTNSLQKGGMKEWSTKLNKSFQEVELKALLFERSRVETTVQCRDIAGPLCDETKMLTKT